MPIRTYGCPDCGRTVEVVYAMEQWADPPPPCECAAQMEQQFKPPGIGGSVQARAAKIAEDIAVQDFGLTNFNMNNHGDPAAPRYGHREVPRVQGVDSQAILKGLVGSGSATINPDRGGAGFAPLRQLQDGIKRGAIPDLVGKRNLAKNAIKVG